MKKTRSTKSVGDEGENRAAEYLMEIGYIILDRNFRTARGELDIVASKDDVLVFIEVKTARSRSFGSPVSWVTPQKQRQIGRMAALYLQEHEIVDTDCRFDVIGLTRRGTGWEIEHLKSAFWLEE